jgi:8-oxo-dGTP pyrophosphatase MutT (NUDIX family)
MFGDDLPDWLAARLEQPLPGRAAQSQFEPELSFGRHFSDPPGNVRLAAVILLLYQRDDEWRMPLTVRPKTMADHAGQISLPGGMIETGETSQAAALRELYEELGVSSQNLRVLGQLTPLYLFVSNFHVMPWVATCATAPELIPDGREVAEAFEFPLSGLLQADRRGSHISDHRGFKFAAPHYAWNAHRIWGATGMIMAELAALLNDRVVELAAAETI